MTSDIVCFHRYCNSAFQTPSCPLKATTSGSHDLPPPLVLLLNVLFCRQTYVERCSIIRLDKYPDFKRFPNFKKFSHHYRYKTLNFSLTNKYTLWFQMHYFIRSSSTSQISGKRRYPIHYSLELRMKTKPNILYEDSNSSSTNKLWATYYEKMYKYQLLFNTQEKTSRYIVISLVSNSRYHHVYLSSRFLPEYVQWSYIVLRNIPPSKNICSWCTSYSQLSLWNIYAKTQQIFFQNLSSNQVKSYSLFMSYKMPKNSCINQRIHTDTRGCKLEPKEVGVGLVKWLVSRRNLEPYKAKILTVNGSLCNFYGLSSIGFLHYDLHYYKFRSLRKVILINTTDLPIYIPPTAMRHPEVDVSFLLALQALERNQHNYSVKHCHLQAHTLEISKDKMPNISSLSFDGTCKFTQFVRERKAYDNRIITLEYEFCSLTYIDELEGKMPLSKKARHIDGLLSWTEANFFCQRQGKALPSFHSIKEILTFVRYWYPFHTRRRSYGEVAIYIDLISQVSLIRHSWGLLGPQRNASVIFLKSVCMQMPVFIPLM